MLNQQNQFGQNQSGQNPFGEDIQLIPWWSKILAVGSFIGAQAFIHLVLVPSQHFHRPIALTTTWGILVGMFLAFYMLMIGYVMRDSKRRGMNPGVWLLILISLLPSGVGFIVYFLLRQPVTMKCPQCSAAVCQEHNFCTKCQYQLKPVCEDCQRSLRRGDVYCAHCGSAVKERQQLIASHT